ncbi:hypothetical protein CI610_00738 [invertebrate metagenome]|uniref:Uncharacterized protein n=1 Tax=invertebrate metagenome TaxID=1711999 RepID=A0A2H9TAJ0_9ZZZZ
MINAVNRWLLGLIITSLLSSAYGILGEKQSEIYTLCQNDSGTVLIEHIDLYTDLSQKDDNLLFFKTHVNAHTDKNDWKPVAELEIPNFFEDTDLSPQYRSLLVLEDNSLVFTKGLNTIYLRHPTREPYKKTPIYSDFTLCIQTPPSSNDIQNRHMYNYWKSYPEASQIGISLTYNPEQHIIYASIGDQLIAIDMKRLLRKQQESSSHIHITLEDSKGDNTLHYVMTGNIKHEPLTKGLITKLPSPHSYNPSLFKNRFMFSVAVSLNRKDTAYTPYLYSSIALSPNDKYGLSGIVMAPTILGSDTPSLQPWESIPHKSGNVPRELEKETTWLAVESDFAWIKKENPPVLVVHAKHNNPALIYDPAKSTDTISRLHNSLSRQHENMQLCRGIYYCMPSKVEKNDGKQYQNDIIIHPVVIKQENGECKEFSWNNPPGEGEGKRTNGLWRSWSRVRLSESAESHREDTTFFIRSPIIHDASESLSSRYPSESGDWSNTAGASGFDLQAPQKSQHKLVGNDEKSYFDQKTVSLSINSSSLSTADDSCTADTADFSSTTDTSCVSTLANRDMSDSSSDASTIAFNSIFTALYERDLTEREKKFLAEHDIDASKDKTDLATDILSYIYQ